MKYRENNPEFRRGTVVTQVELSQRSGQFQRPQPLSAPSVMMQDTWKRYADSRLKQFNTR